MTAFDIALDLIRRGIKPVPVPVGSKGPVIRGWQHLDITAADAARFFPDPMNVGAIMGPRSGGLTDVDLDCGEAVKLAPCFLPATRSVYGRASKRRSHHLYRIADPDPKAGIKLNDENRAVVVELRLGGGGKGAQSIWPGSVHQGTGELYAWDEDGEPANSSCAELKAAIVKIAVGTIIARGWPAENRHDAAMCVGGLLARANWSTDDIGAFIVAVQDVAGVTDPSHVENGRAAAVDAAEHHLETGQGRGLPMFAEAFGEATAKQIAKLLGYRGEPVSHGDDSDEAATLEDFHAYLPQHRYIYRPTRELWPKESIDARVPRLTTVASGKMKASLWLDRNQAVQQMTWAPGEPELITDRLLVEGGWVERPGVKCFNLYRPPAIVQGDPTEVEPWLRHVHQIYPNEADHIIMWFAHRVQRPGEKINHALVLGGEQGIGKDTIVEPLIRAVGPWNSWEVTPQQLMGRFNEFLKSTVLRISEVHDLGDFSRNQFYEHCKAILATPPFCLSCDGKNLREHKILNVCGVIFTTNHKDDGIFLPADDRRHYLTWSEMVKENFTEDYWNWMWGWYESGGFENVAAYLATLDISAFNPKAPPQKTEAFRAVVDANRGAETDELQDVIDDMCQPDVITVFEITDGLPASDLAKWLKDRRNSRSISSRFKACGYVPVRNPDSDAASYRWRIRGQRQTVYAKATMTPEQRVKAARDYKRRMEEDRDAGTVNEEVERMAREDADAEYRTRRAQREHARRWYNPGDNGG